MERLRLAIAPFLLSFPEVRTLGIRSLIDDYSRSEQEWMALAHRVFFPSMRFAEVFHAARIPTFPNVFSYRYQRSRILQVSLAEYLDCPHPRTRLYYGTRQKGQIARDFPWPFWLMGPKVTPGTKHLVTDTESLAELSGLYNPVIVQEWIPWREQVQVICVQFRCVGAVRYHASPGHVPWEEPISPAKDLSDDCLDLAHGIIRAAQIDDIVLECGMEGNRWQLIGMHRPAVSIHTPSGTFNRHHHVGRLIREGVL